MKKNKCLLVGASIVFCLGVYASEAAAAPHQITTCKAITAPGSYVLAKNLTSTGDCLIMQANFITIDLGGFTINGNGTGNGITDSGVLRMGIAVHDGTIRNFATGIDLKQSFQTLIERMRLQGNTDYGVAAGFFNAGSGEMAIVKDSLFYQNGKGLAVGARSVVTGNTAFNNTLNGISVGAGSTVIGNAADRNGTVGLEILEGSTAVNNTMQENGVPGSIGLRVFCPANLLENTALKNGTNLVLIGTGCNSVNNLAP
jgi:hypothetical protein